MRFPLLFWLFSVLVLFACRNAPESSPPLSVPPLTADTIYPFQVDSLTIQGKGHYVKGWPAEAGASGMVNVVVEIPTGSVQKWEVDKKTGLLKWEIEDGNPRVVKYLGYPGNYGMIPNTLLPKEAGGDGDPLDIIVLGPPVERGKVVAARVVGVLKLLDRGEQDDKLIAVSSGSAFESVQTLEELTQGFNGVLDIVETWFSNYKGPKKMKSQGYGDKTEALAVLEKAIEAYRKQ